MKSAKQVIYLNGASSSGKTTLQTSFTATAVRYLFCFEPHVPLRFTRGYSPRRTAAVARHIVFLEYAADSQTLLFLNSFQEWDEILSIHFMVWVFHKIGRIMKAVAFVSDK